MRESVYARWPEQLKRQRGLLNGERVQMAYQACGLPRWQLARKIGLPAAEIKKREAGWHFWESEAVALLTHATDFPIGFFVQDDPPKFGPTFLCGCLGTDEAYCDVLDGEGERGG